MGRRAIVLCGLLFAAAFAVYWVTLSGGVLGGDAGELQFVPPILGLTHPTGYPLQVLLHKAWSLLPGGSVAYRLNLLDAWIAAVAVCLVAACGWRLSGRWLPGLLAGATFGFGELWWAQAVTGDKYTLNGLFLALVLLLYLTWRAERDDRWLGWLALAYGLSLTHHRSMLLVAPALALGLALEGWRPRSRRQPLGLLGLAAAPLALYLYVPWAGARGLPPGSWQVDTPGAFLEYLLDRGYTSQIRPDAALAGRLREEATALARSYGPLGVLLGLVGLIWTARRQPRLAAVLGAVFVPQAVLGASYLLESNYALPRHWVFYLPAFLVWAFWVAGGLDAAQRALEWAGRRLGRPRGRGLGLAGAALAAIILLSQGATVWSRSAEARIRAQHGAETLDAFRQDLQRSPLAERFGRLAFDLAGPEATIVADWEQATVLWYLQRVEGRRADIRVVYPVERLDAALDAARREGRPLYLARAVPGLAERGVPSAVGPLVRLLPGPDGTLPEGAVAVEARLEEGITLAGVRLHTAEPPRAGGVLPMTLSWRLERPVEHDYAVSVRLLGPDGGVLAQHDEQHPALGTSPMRGWPTGAVVGDYHELPLGNRLAPGAYRVGVVVYRPEPLRNLRALGPDGRPGEQMIRLPPFELRGRGPGLLDAILGRLGR